MKVIALNGSPKKEGNTWHALEIIGKQLQQQSIEFEIFHVGNRPIRGCLACGMCAKHRNEECGIGNDGLNLDIQDLKNADGIILASPVYFSGIAGTMKSYLDRLFYVSGSNGNLFRHKVGAALAVVRRTGGSSTLDGLNHYLSYSEMLISSSNYWNVIHGRLPGEVHGDAEGVQTLEVLANNMAYFLQIREAAKAVVGAPTKVQKVATNFVR